MPDQHRDASAQARDRCNSCHGTGEIGSETGPAPCPDCGGAGYLPSAHMLVEWRARDIERAHAAEASPTARDIRFLLAELRRARDALTEIAALAQELSDDHPVAARLRYTASQALRLYQVVPEQTQEKVPGA
jgi:hypothetical protein